MHGTNALSPKNTGKELKVCDFAVIIFSNFADIFA